MGPGFRVVFESALPPYGTHGGDRPAVVQRLPKLNQVARQAGLPALGDFESYTPAELAGAADYADAVDLEGLDLAAPAEWFEPAAGLAAVRGLAACLRRRPRPLAGQAEVLVELAGLATELADAGRAGVRFRFAAGVGGGTADPGAEPHRGS